MRSLPPLQHQERAQTVLLLAAADGGIELNQTYGGSDSEAAYAVIQTKDSGFAIIGHTKSYGAGKNDFWLVKTDVRGEVEWSQTYGGSDEDKAFTGIQTKDEGFALAGSTDSIGAGGEDFWLVKTDAHGEVEWNQTYGGSSMEKAYSVIETVDGGFALAGIIQVGPGVTDGLLVKTDVSGKMEWSQAYGGSMLDDAKSVIQTEDGGFVLVGSTYSFGTAGTPDFWLVKTNKNGGVEWNQTYGGTGDDWAQAGIKTTDGGFALAGNTVPSLGRADGLLVKFDVRGEVEWNRTIDFQRWENIYSIIQTQDSGFVLAGSFPENGEGFDGWLVKTDVSGEIEWVQTYGGPTTKDEFNSVIETADGGFVIVGRTDYFGAGKSDFWLMKTTPPDTTPPILSEPSDITCEEGTTGHEITWTVGDHNPDTYEIYSNSKLVDSGSWVNGTISYNIDDLTQGTYNITLVVWDTAETRVSDTVWITVEAPTTTLETSPVPEFPIIRTLELVLLITFATLGVRRKNHC